MKNLSLLFIGLFMIPMFLLTSCDRGDDPTPPTADTDKYTILKDYMVANSYDLDHVIGGSGKMSPSFVIDASAVFGKLSDYYIMDTRSATDFAAGKLTGANNVAFKDILTEGVKAGTKPILVVCYSGNTATYATALLRLYGFRSAVALKWGMSGWNSTYANHPTSGWNNRIGNNAATSSNWNPAQTPAPAVATYDAPKLMNQPLTTGDAILKARVEAVVAAGFKTVDPNALLVDPTTHFIVNYFSSGDFLGYGHIKGSHRIQPFNLAGTYSADAFKNTNLDASKKIAVYCYTGQTSGVIAAWLNVLGYDSYSGVQGMNRLWNTNPGWESSGNKWTTAHPKEYAN